MRGNTSFIPINDNMDKLEAFSPSLERKWRDNQKIKSKPFQIETMDVLHSLRKSGWMVTGVNQTPGRDRRIKDHTIRLNHPDFTLKQGNKKEGIAQMLLSNSCNGSSPLNMDIGMFREVCTNGLVAFDTFKNANTKIRHIEKDYSQLEGILCGMNIKTEGVLQEFSKLKERDLTPTQILQIAEKASSIRFEGIDFNPENLLKVNREEDRGNNLWSVYNRIQENLTQQNMLIDNAGKAINSNLSVKEDIKVNKELFSLVSNYI